MTNGTSYIDNSDTWVFDISTGSINNDEYQFYRYMYRENGVTRIELWRVSDGTLTRTINTDAVRNARGLDLSPDSGLVASMERFAYGDSASWLQWTVDGSGLWMYGNPFRRVNVAGAVLQTARVRLSDLYVTAATPGNACYFPSDAKATAASRVSPRPAL